MIVQVSVHGGDEIECGILQGTGVSFVFLATYSPYRFFLSGKLNNSPSSSVMRTTQ
jgi:hypothetical protein